MRNETFDSNHRCPGSLSAHCRILKNYQEYGTRRDGWCLFVIENDFDYDAIYPVFAARIKFCPFCGKELE